MAKKSFLEQVMSFITGGDEGKIKRFQKRGISQLKQSVSAMESEIETLNLKKEDAEEAQAEALVNIDVDKLGSIEDTDAYIVVYLRTQKDAESKVTKIDDQIKEIRDKIAVAEKLVLKLS